MIRTLRQFWWIPALFIAVALAVYGQSLGNALVLWDDTYLIARNPLLRSISLTSLRHIFTSYDPELYIPLTFLSYQIDYFLAGPSATMVHATNLALHTANALLVAWVAYLLLPRSHSRIPIPALCVGLFFLVHPLNTEAVSWASGRKDVLSGFFFLLALGTYLRTRTLFSPRMYWSSVCLFLLGLLAKVTVFTLPVLLLILDWNEGRSGRRMWIEKIPYVALSIIFGIVAVVGKQHIISLLTPWQTLLMSIESTAFYVQKFAMPVGLSPIYPGTIPDLFSTRVTVSLLALILITVLCALSLRRTRIFFAGWAFFLAAIAPSFMTFTKGSILYLASDRYAYLPSIGLLIIIGGGATILRERLHGNALRTAVAVCGVVIALLGFLAHQQSLRWRDTRTLFEYTVAVEPDAVAAHTNLGLFYAKSGDLVKARESLERSLAIQPTGSAYIALGKIDAHEGDIPHAAERYRNAIAAEPQNPEPHFVLAEMLLNQGKRTEAIAELREVLRINPSHTPAMNNIAALLIQEGKFEEAAAMFKELLAVNPYYSDAHFNYAVALLALGRSDEAAQEFAQTLVAQPALLPALQRLIPLLLVQGKNDDAIGHLRTALEQETNRDLAALALDTIKKIVDRPGDDASARELLEWMMAQGIVRKK
ncbi:MAG: hypothetical protein G01um101425_907 [Candidatus Peregrinibacteria bacterium Gr01-1014_25]|nr:MAG: hypothetical protein G01um101425_907 [Candidatus Peregrinibacteria bacterium Gr01-1014_25]